MGTSPDRQDILDMLAPLGGRSAHEPTESIDSMELAWLVQQVETRYHVSLPLADDELARMSTIDGAVDVLRTLLTGAGSAHD
jgi:hypothetical protein